MKNPYPFTPGVKALLIANVAVFLVQLLPVAGRWVAVAGTLIPVETYLHGQLWRIVTYMFLHSTSDGFHLLLNMLALWMIGGELEERWGTARFVRRYLLFGAAAALFAGFYLFDPVLRWVPVMGASGAVFGLLTAFAVYYPNRMVLLFFVLPLRAWVVVAGFAVLSLVFAFSQGSGIAHLVHLGGIAAAFLYLGGCPLVLRWRRKRGELRTGRILKARADDCLGRKKYYEEKVDPLLEKITREGERALTAEERRVLEDAWRLREK